MSSNGYPSSNHKYYTADEQKLLDTMRQLRSQHTFKEDYHLDSTIINSAVKLDKNSSVSKIIHLPTQFRPADNEALYLDELAAAVRNSPTATRTLAQLCTGDYEISMADPQVKKPFNVPTNIVVRRNSTSKNIELDFAPACDIFHSDYPQQVTDCPVKEKVPVDYGKTMFVHFTYCSNMKTFPGKFHALWNKYFEESPINEVIPVLGTRNVKNLQRRLTYTISLTIST
ncbi:unnamed protein product [Rotaria magnacalcarata]|uniref:Uncharacterized protein n=1 Tax=Rotaria magnacalcarata TaxID=392030 RepID=A0A816GJR3_9BILA|nr:unnamed protein product [Rotaria magnacalcarata]CAF1675985.1 unnamed protein product [Rotaria magnacalcarata]CAF2033061.1 unnamed protein product [Rotaria magnacalcarata]CAF2052265.1 unnamed protein product [Rotaria magnacalcarata]CAF4025847.1 unnamed protein product [Rotaria magnacalcarata]